MNTTTLNMTTLDGGIIIKRGEGGGATINNQDKVVDITENGTTEVVADGGFTGLGKVTINTEVSGGGADLEGEYFLAKPNGRYWKSKLARMERNKYPAIIGSLDTFTNEQMESMNMFYTFIGYVGFSGIGDNGGLPDHGTEISYFGPPLYTRLQEDILRLQYELTNNWVSLFGAWQEGSMIIQNNAGSGLALNGIVDLVRILMEIDGMSDDEILAMVSEMCMMEQVTKEEYESWYNW